MRFVALLQAVNVGGRRKLEMRTLRALCEALGYLAVETYIQSGNVVFDSPIRSTRKVEEAIGSAIAREAGLNVVVFVRTATEVARVAAGNPFLRRGADPKRLHVTFLATRPAAARVGAIDPAPYAPDDFEIVGREIYLHTPSGYGRTKIGNSFFERALGTPVTTRNWNTVTKLAALTG